MIKRIAIVGPESTGKSSLCQSLSSHFKDIWVPEFARLYLSNLEREYNYEDLLTIAKGQIESENILANAARNFLFCDTTLLTIKIWSEFKYGKSDCWILEEMEQRKYHHHLLCNIDMEWTEDPLRENPNDREELLEIHKKELDYYGYEYTIISGSGDKRINNAIEVINKLKDS